jgi:hypothetical protein
VAARMTTQRAPIQLIGAGFGRTGTLSLKLALEQLGVAPCYHMTEVFQHPEHVAVWSDATDGRPVDWDALFSGYAASVDWPGCTFWRELADHYRDAKVLLTLRSPASWYASVHETIYQVLSKPPPPDPTFGAWHAMVTKLVAERTFGGRFADRAHAIGVYERHAETVQRALPRERLLVYEVARGWQPLCEFLGLPIPDGAFPRVNSKDEFRTRAGLT